jgi:hypothetical protein
MGTVGFAGTRRNDKKVTKGLYSTTELKSPCITPESVDGPEQFV